MTTTPSSQRPPFKIGGLGEIAIRCANLDAMEAFYRDVIGLDLLAERGAGGIVFFKIAEGVAGHTTVLALFAADAAQRDVHPQEQPHPATGTGSSLHHIALSLPL